MRIGHGQAKPPIVSSTGTNTVSRQTSAPPPMRARIFRIADVGKASGLNGRVMLLAIRGLGNVLEWNLLSFQSFNVFAPHDVPGERHPRFADGEKSRDRSRSILVFSNSDEVSERRMAGAVACVSGICPAS